MRLMPAAWPVVPVDDWSIAGVENQGQHSHEWLRHSSWDRTWLFKPARPARYRSMSEDVVEKLGSELARLVGVPAARVELANRHGTPGALVEDARLPDWDLQLGQVLMPEVVPDYEPNDPEHRGYNVRTIRRALERFAAPPESTLPTGFGAFDAFAGYLLFDALIAHGDRHDRNWAVLVPPPGASDTEALCASFDHAASLGFQLTEEKRAQLLHGDTGTVAGWASGGRARRFEHRAGRTCQTLVDLAGSAVTLCEAGTREYWRERILSVVPDAVRDLVAGAPEISETTRLFTIELVMINRGRLLDVLC